MIQKILQITFLSIVIFLVLTALSVTAQPGSGTQWTKDGNSYMRAQNGSIVQIAISDPTKEITLVNEALLTPKGSTAPLKVRSFAFSEDMKKVLIYTNTKKVWRYDTRGDYWVADLSAKTLKQIGSARPDILPMYWQYGEVLPLLKNPL